ncbi:glucosaminidase domain-containing protein [Candidatus Woesearchaeota archaeon]|nr:glucosaminidase domain-containing protein [Candidatus Woesearchaeota archaeon]
MESLGKLVLEGIMLAVIVFVVLSIAVPGFAGTVASLSEGAGSLLGIKLKSPANPDGSGGSTSCVVNVDYCQLSVLHAPSMPTERVREVLRNSNSPAFTEEPDIAEHIYAESQRTGIDDAFAMAFFKHESSFGKYGKAPITKSIGNIRYTAVCKNTYDGTEYDGFCRYQSWKDGVTAWYNLIRDGYVNQGQDTLGEVIAKYAPCNENNVNTYIASVTNFVDDYRGGDGSLNSVCPLP